MSLYIPWFVIIITGELVSALTIFHPVAHGIALIVATAVMFALAARTPAVAAALLLTEYIIGSKGALLRFGGDGVGHGGIPLRMAWFGAFFLGWLVWSWQHGTYKEWPTYIKGRRTYLILAALLAFAFLVGKLRGNPFLLADANGWGVWVLLLPALDLAHHLKEELKQFIPPALLVASAWMMTKTLALFYLFTHLVSTSALEAVYLWVRRTGVGEITRAVAETNIWRIFFQSHIYLLPIVIGVFWYTLTHAKLTPKAWLLGVGAWATLIISLSRSLFLGVAAGLVCSLAHFLFRKQHHTHDGQEPPRVCTAVTQFAAILIGACALIGVAFYAPPRPSGSLSDALLARVNLGEEAAVTRWKLLPVLWEGIKQHPVLGSGFGATVTYESRDPRVVAATGGVYTTYAFEWGWLEHWFKFGILGIPLLLWILIRLGRGVWRSPYQLWWRGTLLSSLVALTVTHIFTPYLNHPLGIISLIVLEAGLLFPYKHKEV